MRLGSASAEKTVALVREDAHDTALERVAAVMGTDRAAASTSRWTRIRYDIGVVALMFGGVASLHGR